MRKHALQYLSFTLLYSALSFGAVYESKHFIIQTELDSRFAEITKNVTKAYYENMLEYGLVSDMEKILGSDEEQLIIYYSETESDAKQLFKTHGHSDKQGNCYYAPDVPAIYVYRRRDDGEYLGFRPLLYGITYHLVAKELPESPVWFKEGISSFFSDKGQIVKSELVCDSTNPEKQQILREEMEKVGRANIKRLYSSTDERFSKWDLGAPFVKALLCWLNETGQLKKYMNAVKTEGFELEVLEKILEKSFSKINMELLRFIKENMYADAYLADGRQAADDTEKKQAFHQALELRPGYYAAYLDLAKLHYRNKDYEKAMQNLELILV